MFIVPALRAIRAAYPKAHITAIVSPRGLWILSCYPDLLDTLIEYNIYHPRFAKWKLARRLKPLSFDLHFNFDAWPEMHHFYTQHVRTAKTYRMVRALESDDTVQVVQTAIGDCPHISRQYLQLTEAAGLPIVSETYCFETLPAVVAEWEAKWRKKLKVSDTQKVVLLHAGNHSQNTNTLFQKKTFDSRAWRLDYFVAYCKRMADTFPGLTFVTTGGYYEKKLTRPLSKALKAAGLSVVDVAGKTTGFSFLGLFKAASLMISGDTGPMHLAAASKTPLIGLYFSVNPNDTGPKGDPNKAFILQSPIPCAPCLHTAHEHQCPETTNCVQELTPGLAWLQSQAFLNTFLK
ncbi:MAG: glycosyltransferase family 9 protein [Candidatus Margulisiibacteriota bacterium]